jgi:hypothetical protein
MDNQNKLSIMYANRLTRFVFAMRVPFFILGIIGASFYLLAGIDDLRFGNHDPVIIWGQCFMSLMMVGVALLFLIGVPKMQAALRNRYAAKMKSPEAVLAAHQPQPVISHWPDPQLLELGATKESRLHNAGFAFALCVIVGLAFNIGLAVTKILAFSLIPVIICVLCGIVMGLLACRTGDETQMEITDDYVKFGIGGYLYWDEAEVFGVYGQDKQGARGTVTYLLAGKGHQISWVRYLREPTGLTFSVPFAMYDAKMEALNQVIVAKTGYRRQNRSCAL